MLFITAMMGFLLILSGCPGKTTQDNQANNNATPVNTQNNSGEEVNADKCTNVTKKDVQDVIDQTPSLKKQFDDGNFSFDFTGDSPANYKLIFKGSIKGESENLLDLFKKFNKFRGKSCVKFVSFTGDENVSDFEWNSDSKASADSPKADCKTNIDRDITQSLIKGQLDENLSFYYDLRSRVLTFKGYVGDPESKDYFSELLKKLQSYMDNGCISKIVFTKSTTRDKDQKPMVGFEWGLCEYPLCDSAGGCAPCNRKDSSVENESKTESKSDAKTENPDSK